MATTEPRSAAAPERGWKGGCDPGGRPCLSVAARAPGTRPGLGGSLADRRPRGAGRSSGAQSARAPGRPLPGPSRPHDERGLRDASFCVVHFTRRDVLGVHHVAARTVFLTEHCSVCVQTTFFIHLSANGQLDSLRVLATGNRAAVTTGCRCRFETLISVPLVRTESGVTSRAVGPCPTS